MAQPARDTTSAVDDRSPRRERRPRPHSPNLAPEASPNANPQARLSGAGLGVVLVLLSVVVPAQQAQVVEVGGAAA